MPWLLSNVSTNPICRFPAGRARAAHWPARRAAIGCILNRLILLTAGNLLFVGDLGHNFRALDQENGKVLWETMLPGPAACIRRAARLTTSPRAP